MSTRPDPTASLLPHDPNASPPPPRAVEVFRAVVGIYPEGGACAALETIDVPVEAVEQWREDAGWHFANPAMNPEAAHTLYATSHAAAQAAVSNRIVHELLAPGVPTRAEAITAFVRRALTVRRDLISETDGDEPTPDEVVARALLPDPRLTLPH